MKTFFHCLISISGYWYLQFVMGGNTEKNLQFYVTDTDIVMKDCIWIYQVFRNQYFMRLFPYCFLTLTPVHSSFNGVPQDSHSGPWVFLYFEQLFLLLKSFYTIHIHILFYPRILSFISNNRLLLFDIDPNIRAEHKNSK